MSQPGRASSQFGYFIAATALLASQGGWLERAHACSTFEPLPFVSDPGLRAADNTPPTPLTGGVARVTRFDNVSCDDDGKCTESTCSRSGRISLEYFMPTDDQSESDSLGYRIVWLRGEIPPSAVAFVQGTWPLGRGFAPNLASVYFTVGFDEVKDLDAEIAVIAVDRAGNESSPSEPIALKFSGCTETHYDSCLEAACSVQHIAAGSRTDASRVAWLVAVLLIPRVMRRRSPELSRQAR